jgi:hypothetical protein
MSKFKTWCGRFLVAIATATPVLTGPTDSAGAMPVAVTAMASARSTFLLQISASAPADLKPAVPQPEIG